MVKIRWRDYRLEEDIHSQKL